MQIYLGTSSLKRANNVLELLGVDYVVKNCALVMMLKALPLVHFWSAMLLKEQKRSKCWSDQRKFLVKSALKITTNQLYFTDCFLVKFALKTPAKSADFFPKNPVKFDFSFRDLSEALSI